jgi:hypothetical protein
MELNRNQFFLLGVLVLLVGLQLRFVGSFVLNESSSRFLAERFKSSETQRTASLLTPNLSVAASSAPALRTIRPPDWLSWALMSFGGVLMLHSLAMKKPG